jgi:hypothetical protein
MRFVPVELWTGAPWDGTQEIGMAPAALEFGRRGDKRIKGPMTWNGIQVYERLNGGKLQLFAVRDDRTGLGPCLRFALSAARLPWRGEIPAWPLEARRGARVSARLRAGQVAAQSDDRGDRLRLRRRAALAALSLFMEGRGRGTDMRYVYTLLRGLVDVQGNE